MTKIAIITDQHFGARKSSAQYLSYYEQFYSNVFFPTLKKHKIRHVIIAGDTFDERRQINTFALSRSKEIFFDPLRDYKVTMLVGNHDCHFKNTNFVNTPQLVLSEYTNINVIEEPMTIDIDIPFCFIPWMNPENYSACMTEMQETNAEICIGHFEISGFSMYRDSECHDGLSKEVFKKFDKVFSGHFHHKSDDRHIYYLGNPYELTWQDYGDPRGFHLFDTETRKLTFIKNPYTLFERFEYDDTLFDPDSIDMSIFADKYVKVIVVNKTDFYKFDKFITKLNESNSIDVRIIENFSEFEDGKIDDTVQLEDTQSILTSYIDSLEDCELDKKNRLKSFMKGLYIETIAIDNDA